MECCGRSSLKEKYKNKKNYFHFLILQFQIQQLMIFIGFSQVRTDSLWRGLSERRGWGAYLFKPRPGEQQPDHSFYRKLYPRILKDIEQIENNWRCGRHTLQRINCRSENSKGVYCLQYDDRRIVSGLRDNTIKIWDRQSLQCAKVRSLLLKPSLCEVRIH